MLVKANKKVFDDLYKYKSEIVTTLGISLIWSRSDDIKSSKVYCQLENEVLKMKSIGYRWLVFMLNAVRSFMK